MPNITPTTRIPLPAGATAAEEWHVGDGGHLSRLFYGTQRGSHVHVNILGWEHYSGGVQADIRRVGRVHVPWRLGFPPPLDSSALRELAADALAAADELDSLAGPGADVIELTA